MCLVFLLLFFVLIVAVSAGNINAGIFLLNLYLFFLAAFAFSKLRDVLRPKISGVVDVVGVQGWPSHSFRVRLHNDGMSTVPVDDVVLIIYSQEVEISLFQSDGTPIERQLLHSGGRLDFSMPLSEVKDELELPDVDVSIFVMSDGVRIASIPGEDILGAMYSRDVEREIAEAIEEDA